MAKILLVEDDREIATAVQDVLELDKHRVETVIDGEDALARLAVNEYDLIVLDMGLPGISGIEVCNAFRFRGGSSPILFLTANDSIKGKESGFAAGADDYLTKPFHMRELTMRVKALLRRPTILKEDTLSCGSLVVDPSAHIVKNRGETVKLSPIEFALLEFLMRHPGRIFSQDELLSKVWPSDSERTPDTIRTCIRKLRAKIDQPGDPSIIENLHGLGYRLRV
jgi:two-component system, OmpR family, response regulator